MQSLCPQSITHYQLTGFWERTEIKKCLNFELTSLWNYFFLSFLFVYFFEVESSTLYTIVTLITLIINLLDFSKTWRDSHYKGLRSRGSDEWKTKLSKGFLSRKIEGRHQHQYQLSKASEVDIQSFPFSPFHTGHFLSDWCLELTSFSFSNQLHF